ncbi:MAG: NYN domain-containing protein [Planctomycetota bacterium]
MHRARDAGWLQRARNRLLAAISKRIDAQLASLTCVVFDAANPPKNRPRDLRQFGMLVRYAVGYREADDLLEEIIGAHATPRRLTVISSDHRVQRAAQRRRAAFFDSDVWYDALTESGPSLAIPWPPGDSVDGASRSPSTSGQQTRPDNSDADSLLDQSDAEIRRWMEIFGQESPRAAPSRWERIAAANAWAQAAADAAAKNPAKDDGENSLQQLRALIAADDSLGEISDIDSLRDNPFPDGYFDDL